MITHPDFEQSLQAPSSDLAAKAQAEGLITDLVDNSQGWMIRFADGENLAGFTDHQLKLVLSALLKGAEMQRLKDLPC